MSKASLKFSSFLTIVVCLTLFIGSELSAASIKERMAKRIPAITSLKDQGIVGENNKGLLEFRSAKKQADLVAAENKDRKAVYKAIGKSQGTSPDHVGKRRAKMIASKGKKGYWYQKPDGSWYQK